uniref:(northern house mosquito) hypothetical protein n=1 Tax=Culex pipiens TaxID=7175 RepID=A0A8D8L9I6_CULPI
MVDGLLRSRTVFKHGLVLVSFSDIFTKCWLISSANCFEGIDRSSKMLPRRQSYRQLLSGVGFPGVLPVWPTRNLLSIRWRSFAIPLKLSGEEYVFLASVPFARFTQILEMTTARRKRTNRAASKQSSRC